MSSSINNGNQTLTFDYRQEGTSEGFNKLLYTLIPQGIIKGGELSINTGFIVNISPMTCYYKDTTNEVGVRLETLENATVTASQAKPYIVGDFTWVNTEDNYMEFKCVDSPTSTQIVFGRAIFSSPTTISGFDYTYKTWSKEYYESSFGDEIPFKVTVNPNNQLKLNVGKGKAIINGKEVEFTETQTSMEINTVCSNGRWDFLCINENGQLIFVEGADDGRTTTPRITYEYLPIAKIEVNPNPTSILGKVTYIYNNHYSSSGINRTILNIDNVVNTGDSATPIENGTTKFTTGGAYTELNKKQDKITNTIQSSQPTDSNYIGGFTNSSTSTNPTAHNSWTFIDIWNWVKTHIGVRSGTTDSAVGSTTKPIYLDNTGKAIAVSNNSVQVDLASTSSVNIYQASPKPGVTGILKVANGGTGNSNLTSGALLVGNGTSAIAPASTTGGSNVPIYIDSNGKPVAVSSNSVITNLGTTNGANIYQASPRPGITGTLSVSHGGTGKTTLTSGAILVGNGTSAITTASATGNSYTPIYIDSNGKPQPCIQWVGNGSKTGSGLLSLDSFILNELYNFYKITWTTNTSTSEEAYIQITSPNMPTKYISFSSNQTTRPIIINLYDVLCYESTTKNKNKAISVYFPGTTTVQYSHGYLS